MSNSNIIINDYVAGLLYGDGSMHIKDGREEFFFSTTNKQVADRVRKEFNKLSLPHYSFQRDHVSQEKENYELLDIVSTTNEDVINILKKNYIISDIVEKRFRDSGEFLRGYLETKGTLFEHMSRKSIAWRISFSGNKDDINYLKNLLEKLGVKTSSIVRRREREQLGVISESYRLPIQNRMGVAKIIEYIDGEDMSDYLKNKVEQFKEFHTKTAFNRKAKVFKHYKSASQYMARELGITVNGKKNDIRPNGWQLVYLWDKNGVNKIIFNGYEVAYDWLCREYEKETGFRPPKVGK